MITITPRNIVFIDWLWVFAIISFSISSKKNSYYESLICFTYLEKNYADGQGCNLLVVKLFFVSLSRTKYKFYLWKPTPSEPSYFTSVPYTVPITQGKHAYFYGL
jgi:Na+/pantothenate symporter